MKRFDQLTREEKKVLTEEQVNYYARLECADRGIIIPQKPINEVKIVKEQSQKFYSVDYESFVFSSEQDAQDYIDARKKGLRVCSIGNSYLASTQYTKKDNYTGRIETKLLYSEDEAKELKDLLSYNSETGKEWEEYNKSLKEYNDIVNWIWEEINDINHYDLRVEYYDKIYNSYLELAENNNSVAHTFFTKAYQDISLNDIDRDIVDKIIKEPVVDESKN
jgi:hypothetical protein